MTLFGTVSHILALPKRFVSQCTNGAEYKIWRVGAEALTQVSCRKWKFNSALVLGAKARKMWSSAVALTQICYKKALLGERRDLYLSCPEECCSQADEARGRVEESVIQILYLGQVEDIGGSTHHHSQPIGSRQLFRYCIWAIGRGHKWQIRFRENIWSSKNSTTRCVSQWGVEICFITGGTTMKCKLNM